MAGIKTGRARKSLARACTAGVETLERRLFFNAADLDPTYGSGGVAYLNTLVSSTDHAESVLIQPDGKILVTGETDYSGYTGYGNYIGSGRLVLVRYNPDGSLDPTFDEDGKAYFGSPFGGAADALLLPSGKILVSIGTSIGYDVFRLNPDGSRDATFGVNGLAGDATKFNFLGTGGLTVQPDGKIILVGNYELDPYKHTMGALRLNADGSLDTGFGNGGFVSVDFDPNGTGGISDYVHALSVVVQPDGDILLAGEPAYAATPNVHQLDLARLNPDGSLDAGFGNAGRVAMPNIGGGRNVILNPDGTILVPAYDAAHLQAIRFTGDGQLDPTFGTGGIASYRTVGLPNGPAGAAKLAVQSDGSIVVAGYVSQDLAAMRLTPAGALDTSFGSGGFARVNYPGVYSAAASAVAIQPDGKLVVAGQTQSNNGAYVNGIDLTVVRMNPSGTLDAFFGAAGRVITDAFYSEDDVANSMALQADGKIVIGGYRGSQVGSGDVDADVGRFLPNGQPDTSFAGTGSRTVGTSKWGAPIDIAQRDGKTVVFSTGYYSIEAVRLDADGSLDTGSFGNYAGIAGASSNKIVGIPRAGAGAILPDQRVLIVGDDPSGGALMLARLNPDGTADPTFGTNGVCVTAIAGGARANDVVLLPDGRFVVAYNSGIFTSDTHVTLARFNADGSPDLTFGSGGTVTVDPSGTGADKVNHLATDAAGDLIAVGTTAPAGSTNSRFLAIRFTPNGTLDTSFGGAGLGWATVDFGRGSQIAYGVDVQADGKIVLAGSVADDASQQSKTLDMAAARLTANGALDISFNGTGTWTRGQAGIAEALTAGVVIQPDGRIVLGGYALNGAHGYDFVTVRLMGDPVASVPFTAEAYGPYHVPAGGAVTLNAFASPATGRTIAKYEWDLNYDGVTFRPTATGQAATFSATGLVRGQRRPVALRVTDDSGATRIDTTWVDVTNGPPALTAANLSLSPAAIDEGQSTTLSGSFTDADPADAHTVTITWNDGSANTVLNLATGVTTFSASHQFRDDGLPETPQDLMPITVAVSDGIDTTTATASVLVRNVAPTVTLGASQTVNEGATVTISRTVTDPGFDALSYLWHVTTNNGVVIPDSTATTFSFKAPDDGIYTVTLTVTDDDTGVGTATTTVTALNVPPTVTLSGKPTAFSGNAYALTVTATDPGQDTISNWSIDWGDGNVESYPGPTPPALSHNYAANGNYTIKVTATDEDGAWTTTKAIGVVPAPYVDASNVLRVAGGAGDDAITIQLINNSYSVYVNGVTVNFAAGSFSAVAVASDAGNDLVQFGAMAVPISVDLGDGDDQVSFAIVTGSITAQILGGNGNDTCTVQSNAGAISFDGQAGNDTLVTQFGTTGADTYNVSSGQVAGPSMTVSWANLEALTVNATGGADTVNVNFPTSTAGDPKTLTVNASSSGTTLNVTRAAAGSSLSFNGGTGADTLQIGPGAQAAVAFNGNLGTDAVAFTGSDSADAFVIQAGSIGDGSSTVTFVAGSSQAPEKASITAKGGDDSVTIDWSAGKSPVLTGPIAFDGGTGANVINLVGSTGNDSITASATGLSISGNTNTFTLTVSATNVQSLHFGGGSGGNDLVSVSSGTWQVDADTPTGTNTVAVSVGVAGTALLPTAQRLSRLTVAGAAQLSATGATYSLGSVSVLTGGSLDLGAATVLSTASTSSLRQMLANGYANGNWNGTATTGGVGVIRSSVAAAATGANARALAYLTHADLASVPTGQTLLQLAVPGDANASGATDFNDFLVLQNHFNQPGTWTQGDVNYDGNVDFNDFLVLQNNYNHSMTAPAPDAPADAQPDPAPAADAPATTTPSTAVTTTDATAATPGTTEAPTVPEIPMTPAQSAPTAPPPAVAPPPPPPATATASPITQSAPPKPSTATAPPTIPPTPTPKPTAPTPPRRSAAPHPRRRPPSPFSVKPIAPAAASSHRAASKPAQASHAPAWFLPLTRPGVPLYAASTNSVASGRRRPAATSAS